MRRILPVVLALVLALPVSAHCAEAAPQVRLRHLDLAGPAASPQSQLSGLAWHGDELLLLPQFLDFMPRPQEEAAGEKSDTPGRTSPRIFAIDRAQIVEVLQSGTPTPIMPREIPVDGPDFRKRIPGYEGFEAIAVQGDSVFLLIESRPVRSKPEMRGFLVSGELTNGRLVLNDPVAELTPPAELANMCYESAFILGDTVWALYEANGANVNPAPAALRFALDGTPLDPAPFPHVEYRITDVTAVDKDGGFWAVNFYWPGERKLLKPAKDEIGARWGSPAGSTGDHAGVERLLRCRLAPSAEKAEAIALADEPPVNLEPSLLPSNWEGAAEIAFDLNGHTVHGLLLVTDTYPVTRFAFAPLDQEQGGEVRTGDVSQ